MNFIEIFKEMFHACLYFVMLRLIFFNTDSSVTSLRKIRLLLWEISPFKWKFFDLETYLNGKITFQWNADFWTFKGNKERFEISSSFWNRGWNDCRSRLGEGSAFWVELSEGLINRGFEKLRLQCMHFIIQSHYFMPIDDENVSQEMEIYLLCNIV